MRVSPFLSSLLLLLLASQAGAQISGTVTHERNEVLPNATVLLLPDSVFVVTDRDGKFILTPSRSGTFTLEARYVAHGSVRREVTYAGVPMVVDFSLLFAPERLGEVLIEGEHGHHDEMLSNVHLDEGFVEMETRGALAQTLERVAGVSAINVGVGIAKPVIRGLYGNRLIVMSDNVKQKGQQWGTDHGLEIDQYDVEEVEIVKGPASLQYGSDGLGGVLNILPRKIPERNTISGAVLGNFRSNNLHGGGAAKLAVNVNNIFGSVRYSRQAWGDYTVPADSFDYLGFRLPILDGILKNTAGQEQNISGTLGILRSRGLTRLDVTHYDLSVGLFSGAVGIPRSYALQHDGDHRNIDFPSQRVRHTKAVISQEFFFHDDEILHLHAGFQQNLRQEFSFPEFHSLPDAGDERLAMELLLRTWTLNGHYTHRPKPDLDNTYGFDGQYQTNTVAGFEYLLPDFVTWRSGLYAISAWDATDRLLVQGGLRGDYGRNDTEFRQRYIYNGNGDIRDSLSSPATVNDFFNVSGSLGINYALRPEQWWLKVNFGKSFRIPYPNETVSNGMHHGTFRHEMGTPDLRSEHGYQLDISTEWDRKKWRGSVAVFANYFDGYIYLSPSGQFSMLPEAGQIFRYRQHDAVYTGFEADWDWKPWRWLQLHQAYEYVWNINVETSLPLPFTPPGSMLSEVRFMHDEVKVLRDLHLFVAHRHVLAQNRVDRNDMTTSAYNLLDAGIGFKVKGSKFKVAHFEISFSVQNILNTPYLNHLSRYRLINVPEQGRNFVVTVKVPFRAAMDRKSKG